MKKSLSLLSFLSLTCACGTQKINCADPSYFYLALSPDITSVSNDSSVVIKKYTKDGAFGNLISDTTLRIDTFTEKKVARVSDAFPHFLDNDFEVVFIPSETRYFVTGIKTTQKTERIANRNRGNGTNGVCYNDFNVQINGINYTKNSSAAYITVNP